jgi:hypothetical protein
MTFRGLTTMKRPAQRLALSLLAGIATLILWLIITWPVKRDQGQPALGAGEMSRLEGAFRAGSPEFEQYHQRIILDQFQAIVSSRAPGDLVMELTASVRNDTGHTINGLEIRGIVVDTQGFPLREHVAVIIPTQKSALEPNEVISAHIPLERIMPEAERADIRVEVTGVLFD